MENKKFQCCFCDKAIESNQIDITSLIVVSNWDKNQDQQQEQQFFCHINCLKNKLSENAPLYIINMID